MRFSLFRAMISRKLMLVVYSGVLLTLAVARSEASRLAAPQSEILKNDLYEVRLLTDGTVDVTARSGVTRRFRPDFTVLVSEADPALNYGNVPEQIENLPLPNWQAGQGGGHTWDFFAAGENILLTATGADMRGGQIRWVFPVQARFQFEAQLSLPAGVSEPLITLHFKPRRAAWYAVGYSGAPTLAPTAIDEVWQPLIWQERRFPRRSFLATEDMCPLPATLVSSQGVTVGVAADPEESPFRLPTRANARFGVLLRNARGEAQPMVFAPVFGSAASHLQAGEELHFKLRLLVQPGSVYEAYKHLAYHLYGFHDYRMNATCSLNETLENMLAFALNDEYSGWVADLRGFDYTTDVADSVKVVSALHPLSLALITDNAEIYRRRALPMIEYLMSRQKYLFTRNPQEKSQGAAHLLRGPAAEVSELAALYLFSQQRSAVFRAYAEQLLTQPRTLNLSVVSAGASWQSLLAMYRMTGEADYLQRARAGADRYIAERVTRPFTDFSHITAQTGREFWVDYTPKWIDLLELYEETQEPRYLAAAVVGARLYTNYVWLQPRIPPSSYLVNKGGRVIVAGYFPHVKSPPQPMQAPEQMVPAWRVSQIGLTPEASNTFASNPAVMLTHFAPYFLRLAYYTGDTFFRDIARSAVIGRYANFPGYDINGEYTTVYARPDYPLRPWEQLTYNNIYYNHVWPHIAMLTDYLVSDVFTRSGGRINFPSRYAQGYAYLQSKVYGDRAGKFYTYDKVHLWLPAKLLRADSIQINYLSGYGDNNFYLALTNEAAQPLKVTIRLNPDVVPFDEARSYEVEVWQENRAAPGLRMERGELHLAVAGHGITALVIKGLHVVPQFQDRVLEATAERLTAASQAELETPFGRVTGMLISFGRGLTSGYIWLTATEQEVKEVRLHYRQAEGWQELLDRQYPFEFSFPLNETATAVEYWLEVVKADGSRERSQSVTLKR